MPLGICMKEKSNYLVLPEHSHVVLQGTLTPHMLVGPTIKFIDST